MGRLEDNDGLGDEGDGGNVEEWMVREEGKWVVEDGIEDEDDEGDDPGLGYEGCPWEGFSGCRIGKQGRHTENQIPPQWPPFPLRCSSPTAKERFILRESLGGNRIAARDLVRCKLWNASRRRHDSDSCDSDSSFTVGELSLIHI